MSSETGRRHTAHAHNDRHVPTGNELDVLFIKRAAIGGFDESGLSPAGWHWSSTDSRDGADSAWDQRFVGGDRCLDHEVAHSSLRLVRG